MQENYFFLGTHTCFGHFLLVFFSGSIFRISLDNVPVESLEDGAWYFVWISLYVLSSYPNPDLWWDFLEFCIKRSKDFSLMFAFDKIF